MLIESMPRKRLRDARKIQAITVEIFRKPLTLTIGNHVGT